MHRQSRLAGIRLKEVETAMAEWRSSLVETFSRDKVHNNRPVILGVLRLTLHSIIS